GIFLEEFPGVLAALADALGAIREPGARLLDHISFHAEVEQFTRLGDTFPVDDVELDLPEWRGDLVLDYFHAGLVADDLVALLDLADAADVEADRGIEFQRIAARGGFGRAIHHADLHADLVDEDQHGLRLGDRGGEFAEGLAHQAGLQAGKAVAHLAFEFGAWRQRRH